MFCGSLILRMGDFLYFAGTNFCDCERLAFGAGCQFLQFSDSRVVFGKKKKKKKKKKGGGGLGVLREEKKKTK